MNNVRIAIRDSTDSHNVAFFDNIAGIHYYSANLQRFLAGSASILTLKYNSKNIDTVDNVANQIRKQKVNGKYAFSVMTVGDILKTVNNYVSLASTVLSAIAGISLVVSALMIIVTMYMSVAERTKEIGILRALGERRKDIRRLFTAESLLLGLFSAFLGLLLAWLFSILLNNFIYGLIKFNIVQINLANVIFAIVVSLLISLLAALLPARKASKLNPIDALSAD